MSNNYIAIMAGGVGTRFWPASRESRPKQFLDILGIGKTLLQMTFERACRVVPANNVIIVSNKKYKNLILTQLPDINENQILSEPSMNNTAPCVLYSALHLRALNANAVFAVIPSDHMIMKEDVFAQKMIKAFSYAGDNDAIVTLGIQPTRPDTGYGYINFENGQNSSPNDEVKSVIQFKEKPDATTAQKYIDSGDYLWNAGIFVWSAKTVIKSFNQHAQNILEVLGEDITQFGSSTEQEYIDRVYPNTESISVDFAILEKSTNVYTIPVDMDWSDLGTWNSLYSYVQQNEPTDNVIQCGRTELKEASGNLIRSSNEKKLIVVKGISDYIIVDDGDILLIYPRNDEQEIKQIRNGLTYTDVK